MSEQKGLVFWALLVPPQGKECNGGHIHLGWLNGTFPYLADKGETGRVSSS